MPPHPTLDQLQVFVAVAETGSFSAAARRLNRSQSVISYAIANLEAQLELRLFDREGTREPRLTDGGRAMLCDARRIVDDLEELRARSQGLKEGLEGELSAAIDVTLPTQVLAAVLRDFEAQFPTVGLKLQVGALGMVADLVSRGEARIGIGGHLSDLPGGFATTLVGYNMMVPVAAPGHPLAQARPPVPLSVVREHVQLVVIDMSEQTRGQNFNVVSFRTWRLTDAGTKHALILEGLGWGGLPESMVRNDLDAGRLVRLELEPYPETHYPLYAIHTAANPPGPAGSWMISRVRETLSACPGNHGVGSAPGAA